MFPYRKRCASRMVPWDEFSASPGARWGWDRAFLSQALKKIGGEQCQGFIEK